jgi:ABC-type multidrug transport system fused ATPase/permease subunit
MCFFAADGKFFSSFPAACSKDSSSVGRGHSFPETVFVQSFTLRWLVGPFHTSKIRQQRYKFFHYKQKTAPIPYLCPCFYMAKSKTHKEEIPKAKLNVSNLKKGLRILGYIGNRKSDFFIGLFFLFLSSGVGLVFPLVSGTLFGYFGKTGTSTEDLLQELYRIGFWLLLILIVQGIISFGRVYFFARVTEEILFRLRKDVFGTLLKKPMDFYYRTTSQEINAHLASDITLIGETFTIHLAEFIRQVIVGSGGLVMIFIFAPPGMALWFLVIVPPIILISLFFARKIRKRSRNLQEKISFLNARSGELFSGIHYVKMFVTEEKEISVYENHAEDVKKYGISFGTFRGSFFAFIISCVFGTIFFMLFMMVKMKLEGKMEAEQFGRFLMLSIFVAGSLGGLPEQLASIQRALGAADRLMQYKDAPEEKNPGKRLPENLKKPVRFEKVSFFYPSRPDVEVLKEISFEMNPGEVTALVGPSGSGKSTLVSLILRFYQATSGRILLDDCPVEEFDLFAWRSRIGVVPQDSFLFSGSILDNIRYGCGNVSESQIREAASKAYALDFIEKFPDGFATQVGERGIQLSGGQRQRIAIARAILKNPDLLILDEATSNLDAESEHYIRLALEQLMKGRTTLVIAHRLSTIRNADKILVLHQGKIVQQGKHEELMQDSQGLYHHLVYMQNLQQFPADKESV